MTVGRYCVPSLPKADGQVQVLLWYVGNLAEQAERAGKGAPRPLAQPQDAQLALSGFPAGGTHRDDGESICCCCCCGSAGPAAANCWRQRLTDVLQRGQPQQPAVCSFVHSPATIRHPHHPSQPRPTTSTTTASFPTAVSRRRPSRQPFSCASQPLLSPIGRDTSRLAFLSPSEPEVASAGDPDFPRYPITQWASHILLNPINLLRNPIPPPWLPEVLLAPAAWATDLRNSSWSCLVRLVSSNLVTLALAPGTNYGHRRVRRRQGITSATSHTISAFLTDAWLQSSIVLRFVKVRLALLLIPPAPAPDSG